MNPSKFIKEVRQEVSRVTWPTLKETKASTLMVLVLVLLSGLFFWIVDSIISASVHLILGLGV
ncbi:MAG: preprotein translocase subunit SecE [Pseudomonadota bacterium]